MRYTEGAFSTIGVDMTATTTELEMPDAELPTGTPAPVTVHYPSDGEASLARARNQGLPRLVKIAAGALPPTLPDDCLEEWVWLPATAIELANRIALLGRRCAQHSAGPSLHPNGDLWFRGRTAVVAIDDTPILARLVAQFEQPVAERELQSALPDGQPPSQLRPLIARIRRPLRAIGLEIRRVPHTGYRLMAP